MYKEWLTPILISLILTHLVFSLYKFVSTRIQLNRSKEKYERILKIKYKNTGSINVKLFYNKDNNIYGYEVSGHSEYDEYGNDIFAAAISILAQNTLNSMHQITNEKIDYDFSRGYLKCIANNLKISNEDSNARAILKSAELGFYTLRDTYSEEYISIETVVK